MRIFYENKFKRLPTEPKPRLFVETWYSMLHNYSLDSHRVPCMNPINIIREMRSLISKTGKLPVQNDLCMCAAEMKAIFEKDPVVFQNFSFHHGRLKPLLEKISNADKEKIKQLSSELRLLDYYLKDFIILLEDCYLDEALSKLKNSIFEENDTTDENIRRLTANILSLALDRGRSMDALFSMALKIFPEQTNSENGRVKNFREKFELAANILKSQAKSYEVIFRLEKFTRFEDELKEINLIRFSKQWQWDELPPAYKKFAAAVGPVVYAGLQVVAHDNHSAVQKGKNTLGAVLDVLRFEFEPQAIGINDQAIVRKIEPGNARFNLIKTNTAIPNPRSRPPHEEFTGFTQQLNILLSSENIEKPSRKKIESALRYYRTGCDSIHVENKFLNWWMALEYLLIGGTGSNIIEKVEKSVCNILLQTYAKKLLTSFQKAIRFCNVDMPEEALSVEGFFRHIQNEDSFNALIRQLTSHPILSTGLRWLCENLSGAGDIMSFYNRHQQKLGWHIHRIYRMRCDIVHSAQYDLDLSLLAANLEYYLKSILDYLLEQFTNKSTINSIDELLTRAENLTTQLFDQLKTGKTDLFKKMLSEIPV